MSDMRLRKIEDSSKREIPNPKSQIPNKFQISKPKFQSSLPYEGGIGVWNLELVWDLGFGIWDFCPGFCSAGISIRV